MIRTIKLNVDENGFISNENQSSFAGICNENYASQITFSVCDKLLEKLNFIKAEKKLYYRFEITDAENNHYRLAPNEVRNIKEFTVKISNAFTKAAGKLTVALIFESQNENGDYFSVSTYPVHLRIEKGCEGKNAEENVTATIITVFDLADKKAKEQLDCTENQIKKDLDITKQNVEKIFADADKKVASMNGILDNCNTVFNSCEKDKTICESSAALSKKASENAILSNSEATKILNGKADKTYVDDEIGFLESSLAEQYSSIEGINNKLSTKESTLNKEENLMQETFPTHQKYPSAKAVQELVSNITDSFFYELGNINESLTASKADKSEITALNNNISSINKELESLVESFNQKIEDVRHNEDLILITNKICDGKTKEFIFENMGGAKRIYIKIKLPVSEITKERGYLNCYVNAYNKNDNLFATSKIENGSTLFSLYSEKIVDGCFKTEIRHFSKEPHTHNFTSIYNGEGVEYIDMIKLICGEDESTFLPKGTIIQVFATPTWQL